jgi:hypothetical protein
MAKKYKVQLVFKYADVVHVEAENEKQAIQKANDTVESFDSDFGVYLISVYDKMSGKYIYNKNKGRGGYSI